MNECCARTRVRRSYWDTCSDGISSSSYLHIAWVNRPNNKQQAPRGSGCKSNFGGERKISTPHFNNNHCQNGNPQLGCTFVIASLSVWCQKSPRALRRYTTAQDHNMYVRVPAYQLHPRCFILYNALDFHRLTLVEVACFLFIR